MPSLGCCINAPGNQSGVQFVERGLKASERKEPIAPAAVRNYMRILTDYEFRNELASNERVALAKELRGSASAK